MSTVNTVVTIPVYAHVNLPANDNAPQGVDTTRLIPALISWDTALYATAAIAEQHGALTVRPSTDRWFRLRYVDYEHVTYSARFSKRRMTPDIERMEKEMVANDNS